MRKLIINGDDFGLTYGVSQGIFDLLKINAISSTSMMVTVENVVENCKSFITDETRNHIGVHLTTTPENYHRKPLSKPGDIPSLVEPDGGFKHQDTEDYILPAEIEIEWEAQILKACYILGQTPSHLDSHHGVHRQPHLTPIYLKLANKYNIPVRGGRDYRQIDGSEYDVKSTALCAHEWTGKFNGLDALQHSIQENFDKLENNDVLELCTHPGYCDEDLMTSSPWNECREHDLKILKELSQTSWLADNNIELIRFNAI